ncbi:hypothetical protein C2E23DRAFT_712245, partial [Lenzites betulinus]
MIKTAKKHNVSTDLPNPGEELKALMPIWYHVGATQGRASENTPTNRCLRRNHKVQTVAACLKIAKRRTTVPEHRQTKDCGCRECTRDRRELQCKAPFKCIRAARKAIERLNDKWKPEENREKDGLSLTRRRKDANTIAVSTGDDVLFNPSTTEEAPLSSAFRVFCKNAQPGETAMRRRPAGRQVPRESTTVFTDGSCTNNGCENAKAGAGAWFGENDERNTSSRVPGSNQSNQTGEVFAAIIAAAKTPPFAPLKIVTD